MSVFFNRLMSHLSWQYGLAFSEISLMVHSSSLPIMSPLSRSSNANRPSNKEPSREARRPTSITPRPPSTISSPSETADCCSCRKNWRRKNKSGKHSCQWERVQENTPQQHRQHPPFPALSLNSSLCLLKGYCNIPAQTSPRLFQRESVEGDSHLFTFFTHGFINWWYNDFIWGSFLFA